jgi:hypothetical protein
MPGQPVILVNRAGRIVWQYGRVGVTRSRFNRLNTPVQATYPTDSYLLITDQGNSP